jgi:hypothetical protein
MSVGLIGIKFCGGCNPRIDRGTIAQAVRAYLSSTGCTVIYNRLDVDFVIYISGCTADCAKRYSTADVPCIVVAGDSLDAVPVAENELVVEILCKVREYIE